MICPTLLDALAAYSPVTARPHASTAPLYLGSDAAGNMGPEIFDGHIGEIRIWNLAHTALQVRQARTEKLPAQTTGLVAYYDMQDPASSTQLTDLSGQGVTAALGAGTQAPQWVSRCNLTCTAQGNFRGTNPAGAVASRGTLPDTAATAGAARHWAKGRTAPEAVAGATWSLAPNPARQAATLHYELAAGEQARVRVLDLAGFERRRVPTEAARHSGPQQVALPLAGLRPGTYLVEVTAAGTRRVLRLVVNE